MQEEILLKKQKTGTTVVYFDTLITPENYSISTLPAALYLNDMGAPYLLIVSSVFPGNSAITTSDGFEIWNVNGDDNIQRLQEITPGGRVIIGRTFSQDIESVFTSSEKFQNRFSSEMNQMFSGQSENYVFLRPKLFEDFEISFKIERTHDVLNTLSTYNKVYNDFPKRTAQTGVVFGKLEAVQKLQDENGNNIRIPLRGVPIGIFNVGSKFEAATSTDDNGNRIRLNFKEGVSFPPSWPDVSYYANYSSWKLDTEKCLPDKNEYIFDANEPLVSMPEEFQYTVLTNENGEFIIHDVPIGPQTLMFEVDLLQQGLSIEEVALNFFPYRGENISNVDEIPHYFFRQVPIDVVPAWGEAQSGYTEVNVKANLDLRKWSTYYFPPACNKIPNSAARFFDTSTRVWKDGGDIDNIVLDRGIYLDNTGTLRFPSYSDAFFKIGDPYLTRYTPAPLIVEVRDMSREGFPKDSIQMVTIEDILERQGGELNAYAWVNEFSQIKNRAEFRKFGYNVIKLPANLYDPEGYRTDKEGAPQSSMYQKGVWLCAYEFKMYHSAQNLSYRTTGFRLFGPTGWSDNVSRDHFHLNVGYQRAAVHGSPIANISASDNATPLTPILNYPYEKPWTINYPKKYSIPKIPTDCAMQFYLGSSGYSVMEYPLYKDGHIVRIGGGIMPTRNGNVPTGGFGHSKLETMSELQIELQFCSTSFCYSITNSMLYHYEYGPWTEYGRYANNYIQGSGTFKYPNPYSGTQQISIPPSVVKNGEEFQRVEAGYGYYLHPSGMPRVGAKQAGKIDEVDYQCGYDTHRAAHASIYSDAGTLPSYGDFYFATWYNNYSVIFDAGQTTALRLDYHEITNPKNQGAFSIYRVINPGTILDPTQVHDLTQPVFIKKKKLTLNLQRTIIQNEKTTNEPSRFRQDESNPNDFYPWDNFSRPGKGVAEEAKITIRNQGSVNVDVKIGTLLVTIPAQSSETITASRLDRTWHNLTIELESNADIQPAPPNWEYRLFKYQIEFDGITIPDHQWDGVEHVYAKNLPYSKVINNNFPNGQVLYAWTQIKNIKTRRRCGNSDLLLFQKNDITTDGLYFGNGSGTYVSNITFNTSILPSGQVSCDSDGKSSCFCSAYGGFYYGIV